MMCCDNLWLLMRAMTTSVSQMTGKPCIIFVENGLFRDMGNFLFHHYKEFEIEEERDSWLFIMM